MRNVILVDFDTSGDWDYRRAIEEVTHEKWQIEKCVTNKMHGSKLKILKRYFMYFCYGFHIFIKRNEYDSILSWQQFYGLIIAFFCRLFHVKKYPDIYIMTFIFKPKKSGLYNRFMSYIATSGYIKKLIVLSDSEIEYYSKLFKISPNLFHPTRIGVADIAGKIKKDNNREKYYLSVGRSNRDYKFLRDAWKLEYGKLIVINDSYAEEEKEGIECIKNCYGNEYLSKLTNSYAQIIPLEDPNIASGSLSFLQAMMLSIPTIVTENKTVHDYIKDKDNGLIIEKRSEELSQAIKYLDSEENFERIRTCARKTYEKYFSEYSLGIDIGKMLNTEMKKA